MMELGGPYHDFWVLKEAAHPPQGYRSYAGRKDAPLRIEENLLYWLHPMLAHLPTELPWETPLKTHRGLHWFGPTVLRERNAELLARMAELWVDIYEADVSETVSLAIMPTFFGDAQEPQRQIQVPRELLLARLQSLTELARAGSQPGSYLLHLGI